MVNLITKKEFAKLAGVTRQNINNLIKKKLAPALRNDKIDLAAPCVIEYLETRRAKVTPPPSTDNDCPEPADNNDTAPAYSKDFELDDDVLDQIRQLFPGLRDPPTIKRISRMTINQIVKVFGAQAVCNDYIKATKEIAAVRKIDLDIAEKEGKLIPRDLIKVHIFGALEGMNLRLLQDAPRTIASRTYAMCRAGTPIEEAEKEIREIISKHLKGVYGTARRILKGD
jgi:hypothetical protein